MDTSSNINISMFVTVSAVYINKEELQFLSDEDRDSVEQIIMFIMLHLVLLGVVTNVINIRVFVEQGIRNDSTNIGLFSLALFDMLTCFSLIPLCLCYFIRYIHDLPTQLTCIAYATVTGLPVILFSNCCAWTTVYLSLERTLCVVIPMKVKLLLKPKVTVIVLVFIVVFFFTIQIIYSGSTIIVWRTHPVFNRSVAYVQDTAFAKKYFYYYSITSNTGLSSLAIFVVAINTIIMVRKLNQFKKWRQTNTRSSANTTTDGKPMASKDVELIKSVTTVTSIFLVCLSMSHFPSIAVLTLPGVSFGGINRNVLYLVFFVRLLFSAVNASINFFFYIRISSRYKAAFSVAFPKCSRQDPKS